MEDLFNTFEVINKTLVKCKGVFSNKHLSIDYSNEISKIGSLAFKGNESIEHLFIGKNIIDIDAEAFSCCPNLIDIVVDEENPRYTSANRSNCIVDKDTKCLILGCSTTSIPSSISSIGPFAFCGQTKLKEIEIPSNVKKLHPYAFDGCQSLETIIINDGLEEISEYCFKQCSSLQEITLPKTLTIISSRSFGYCYNEYHEEVLKYTEDYIGYIDEEKINLLAGCESIKVIHYSGTKNEFRTKIDLSSLFSPRCYSNVLEKVICIDGYIPHKFDDDSPF